MKDRPTVCFANTIDAAALPEPGEEVGLAFADIASAAYDGLSAMSVAARLAVMAAENWSYEEYLAPACDGCRPEAKPRAASTAQRLAR
jgi:hypothetical protein